MELEEDEDFMAEMKAWLASLPTTDIAALKERGFLDEVPYAPEFRRFREEDPVPDETVLPGPDERTYAVVPARDRPLTDEETRRLKEFEPWLVASDNERYQKTCKVLRVVVATRMPRADVERYLGEPRVDKGTLIPGRPPRTRAYFQLDLAMQFEVDFDEEGHAVLAHLPVLGANVLISDEKDIKALRQWADTQATAIPSDPREH